MPRFRKRDGNRPYLWVICIIFLLLLWPVACSKAPEVVEVTRIVTETVIIESDPVEVEVTRVVTETVIETVEIEEESEDTFAEEPEPPSATGSEDDSGPQPSEPDDGPKVTSRGGSPASTVAIAEVSLETAVSHRATLTNSSGFEGELPIMNSTTIDSTELVKWCEIAETMNKKRCS